MSEHWRYDECFVAFYHEGIEMDMYKVVDALNAAESRIAELEAENAVLKERVAMLDVTAVYKSLGEMGYIEQVDKLNARIAELEEQVWNLNLENERLEEAYWIDETISPDGTLKPSVRKLLERLEKAETDLRLSDDLVKALDNRIAELEEENETLKTACDILRGDNNLLFKRLMSIETPDDLQTLKITYRKEDSEVQE